jgi:hypothetical protein
MQSPVTCVLDDKAAPLKVPPQYVGESCSSLDQQNPRAKIRFADSRHSSETDSSEKRSVTRSSLPRSPNSCSSGTCLENCFGSSWISAT